MNKKNIIQNIIGGLLFFGMVVLTTFIINQHYANYQTMSLSQSIMERVADIQNKISKIYREKYEVTQKELDAKIAELASAQEHIESLKESLAEVSDENKNLQSRLTFYENLKLTEDGETASEITSTLSMIKKQNQDLMRELASVKDELNVLQGNISSLEQGRQTITLYKYKIKLVKTKMQYLKREEAFARRALAEQRDRLAMEKGNKGYLVLDGMPAGSKDDSQETTVKEKPYKVDVKFF